MQKAESYKLQKTEVSWGKLLLCVIGSIMLGTLMSWLGGMYNGYGNIVISAVTPSAMFMAIAWPFLYAMMGWSLYLVLQSKPVTPQSKTLRTVSLVLWILQFAMVLAWTFIMFRSNMFIMAFVWTAIITSLVTALTIVNFKVHKLSSILMVPYWIFMVFMTYSSLIIAIYN